MKMSHWSGCFEKMKLLSIFSGLEKKHRVQISFVYLSIGIFQSVENFEKYVINRFLSRLPNVKEFFHNFSSHRCRNEYFRKNAVFAVVMMQMAA